ncbi:FAD-binding domain-containing protein [Hypoxylon trugodes]|uniref:FAD-binding domain-containing protein n=1 Tax=Hypoxylon trugodes TaxID=326681 RepID=UPI00219C27EF|nr:FAD-binding domain-containing protein [Hypoxylon trugodes]KAI1391762.1 FAD-binding domain-containing protein [Hypoxylon trugodes]
MTSPSFLKDVQWPAGTLVHYPESEAFTNSTARWSIYKAPSFAAVISPPDEESLVSIVKVARAAKIPFLATSGRHGYGTSLSRLQNGLAIDLSKLKSVKIDKDSSTLTIGGGVQNCDVMEPIHEAGYQLPIGTSTQVGLVGATLGGGIGAYQGLFGLITDSLLSVRLVTADGDVVEVSENSNSDLFWGIRGAGCNFGIITSATYRLHKPVNAAQVMTADVIYPGSMKSAYFDVLRTFENNVPAELAIVPVISWDAASNATQIISTFVYSGPESKGREVLAPFLDLNPPVVRLSVVPFHQMPYAVIFGMISTLETPGGIHDIFTVNVRKFSIDTFNSAFEKFDAFYKANPDGRLSVGIFEIFPTQAVAAVPDDATAYPWRDAKGNFMFQMMWTGLDNPVEEAANALGRELRQDFAATSGYDDLSVYVSYAYGDETREQIFRKDKLPRLVALKKKWDPDNVFSYNNQLPTRYP